MVFKRFIWTIIGKDFPRHFTSGPDSFIIEETQDKGKDWIYLARAAPKEDSYVL